VGDRLLIGNLDAEIEIARALTPGPHPGLSSAAGRLVGAAASHMALLARPGDRLWLPAPAPPEELCAVARDRALVVATGPLEEVAPAGQICAWAETESVARHRATSAVEARAADMADLCAGRDWRTALWHLWPAPEVAQRVNHRGFALSLALDRGWALPGAAVVRDVGDLERHLAAGAASAGVDGAWVLKAPLSAAGRERMRYRDAAIGRGDRVRIERLLARFGELLLEPWVDRVHDFACAGLVHPGGVRMFAPHRLDNDPRGVFRAAIIDDAGTPEEAQHRDAVQAAGQAAGEALAAAGYLGPFSVDAYLWRDPTGAIRLQPMSEINARLSFGLLARVAAEDAGLPAGPFELRL
jgi:hypothetical protein